MGLSWKLLIMETLVLAVWWLVCLVCLGEVESGPALMESSSAWVTRGEQAGGLSGLARFWEGTSCPAALVLNGSPLVSYLTILCGFQTSIWGKLWQKKKKSHPSY